MKNLSAVLQADIDPLVNKVEVHEYQKDPSSLIYPMYLNPPSSSYQQASRSYVFTSYSDLTIGSKLHLPINDFFQCFSYAPKLLLTLKLGEVSVWVKNLSRICKWKGKSRGKLKGNCVDDCEFTISNSQMYS